jgi:hypothetical protein
MNPEAVLFAATIALLAVLVWKPSAKTWGIILNNAWAIISRGLHIISEGLSHANDQTKSNKTTTEDTMTALCIDLFKEKGVTLSDTTVKLALEEAKSIVSIRLGSGKGFRGPEDVAAFACSLIGSGGVYGGVYNLQKKSSEVAVKIHTGSDGDVIV